MVRRVDSAVPTRIAATRNSASGCAQGTWGGSPVPWSVARWNSQPATRPIAVQVHRAAGLIGRSRPSGSGGSGSSTGGSGSALTGGSPSAHRGLIPPHARLARSRFRGAHDLLHLKHEVLALLEPAPVALLQQLGNRTRVGELGVRLDVVPRLEHE